MLDFNIVNNLITKLATLTLHSTINLKVALPVIDKA